MKRAFLVGLLAVGLATGTGCCRVHSLVCCPFGPGTGPDTTHCATGGCGTTCAATCDDGCGASCGPAVATSCNCGSCDSCAPCGNNCYPCRGPLSLVLDLLHPVSWCGRGGCGEAYYGDFHGDPPDMCDPCDRNGCWTGGGSCGCGTQGTTGGCASCGSRSGSTPVEGQSQILSESEHIVSPSPNVPTKAAPTKAAPTKKVPAAPAKPQPVSPEAARPIRSQQRR